MKLGTKVICNEFEGVVIELCSWDKNLVVVRLNRGEVCVSISTLKLA